MKRSIAGAALVAVLVTGGLSGCGGNGTDPTPRPTTSVKELGASESPSGTPTPGQQPTRPIDDNPPERPAAMDNADEAGAVAAAEYYLRLTVYAAATGDTAELEAMSGEGCEFCENYISSVKELHGNGGWAELAEVSVSLLDVWMSQESPGQFRVDTRAIRSPYSFSDDGIEMNSAASEDLAIGFLLDPTQGVWIVQDLQMDDPETYGIGD